MNLVSLEVWNGFENLLSKNKLRLVWLNPTKTKNSLQNQCSNQRLQNYCRSNIHICLLTLISNVVKVSSHMPYLQKRKQREKKTNVINLLWKCEQQQEWRIKKEQCVDVHKSKALATHSHELNSVFRSRFHCHKEKKKTLVTFSIQTYAWNM